MDQRIRGYLERVEASPADAPPLDEMERALAAAGAWNELVRVYEQLLRARPDDADLIARGARVLEEKLADTARAEVWLRRLLEAAPNEAPTRDRLVRIYRQRRDERALCDLLEREAARAPTPEQAADAYCLLGENLVELGAQARAVEMWQRALRLQPDHRRALERSRETLIAMGRFEAAQQILEREVAAAPGEAREHALRWTALGRRALEHPDCHKVARACADAALALDPDCTAARVLLESIEALRAGWSDQVRDLRVRALEERDRRVAARLYLQIAQLHAAFDDPAEAEVRIREALQPVFLLWPAMPEALEFLERRHAAADDFEGLARTWETLAEGTADAGARVDLLLRLAALYELRFDDPARAAQARARAAEIDPARADAIFPLLEQLEAEGRLEEAADLLERHVAASPAAARQIDLRLRLADLHLRQPGARGRARPHLEAILAVDPANERAAALLEPLLGADPEALARFLEQRADHAAAPWERVDLLLRAANLRGDGAIELLGKALLAAPDREDVIVALEAAPGARADLLVHLFGRAAEVAPEPSAKRTLLVRVARLLEAQEDGVPKALEAWRRVLALDPADAEAAGAVERLLEANADAEGLARDLEQRLARATGDEERAALRERLAELCERHDPGAAADHLQALVELRGADEALLRRLAAALGAAGRWNERLEVLGRLIEAGDVEAIGARAALLADRLGRPEEAADDWLRALQAGVDAAEPLERLMQAGIAVERIAAALAPRFEAAGAWQRLAGVLQARLGAARAPAARHALLLELAALREERLADPRGALAALGAALAERPDDLELLARLERLAAALDAREEYAGYVRDAWENAPDAPALALARHVAAHADDPALVAAARRRILAADPEDDESLAALADAAAEAGRWAEAGSLLERRLAIAPPERKAELELVRARWLARQGAHGHAVEAYRAALAAGAPEAKVLPALAAALGSAGRRDELVEVLGRQVELARAAGDEAEATRLATRQAQLLEGLQRRAEAAAHWAELLARDPDDEEAFRAMEQLLEQEDTAARAAEVLAPVYEKRGDWQRLRRALEIRVAGSTDPAFRVATLRRLAQLAARELRDPGLAFDALARAFRETPTDALLRSELRVAAGQAGRLEALAEVMAEMAERLHVGGPGQQATAVERELAELYEKRLGDPAAAAGRHRRILAFDPKNLEALRALHRLQPAAEAWAEQFETCLALAAVVWDGAEKIRLWREAAQIAQERLADPARALQALQLVAEAAPDDLEVLAAIERLATARQDWARAALALERLARGDAEAACRLALLRRDHLDDASGALDGLGAVLAADGSHARARRILSDWAAGDRPDAALAAARLDAALVAAGDHDARVVLREAILDRTTEPEARRRLHEELIAIHEVDIGSPPLAFVAAARAFAEFPAFADTLERLAAATGSWEELVDIYEEAARPALLPRIAAVRERELGDLDGAIAAWEGVLAASPDDPAALEALARLYAAAERSEPLVEVLRRAAAAVEGEARAALLMQAADVCALALEDPDRAVPLCREALLAVPDHLPALEMLALHLREDTDRDELVAVLERLALRLPEGSEARADALLRRAHLLTRLGATDGAVRCCEQVLAERPGEDRAVVLLEELAAVGVAAAAAILEPVYRARGDAGRLFDALERRLGDARGADRAAILGEMVELRLAAGDVEGAWPLALARFAAAPTDLAALDAAFALADRLGAHESLADAIENALAERPDDRGLLGRLAALQEEVLGRGADACATWERALAFDSADVEALRAVARLAAGRDDARVREVSLRLAELLPDEAADHLRLAARIAEEAIGDGEAALADWRRVLALAPDDTAAHAAIERLLDATGRVDELADHLRTREADPEVALRLAALLQERLGDVDGALARYERHLDRPAAREGLEAWIRSGAPGAERALRLLDPVLDDVRVRVELRRAAIAAGADRRALLEEIVALLEAAGEVRPAFDAARERCALDPADAAAREALVRLAGAAGAWEALAEALAATLAAIDDDEARLAVLRVLAPLYEERLGRPADAVAAWERILALRPDDAAPLARLEAIHRAAGDDRALCGVLRRLADAAEAPERRMEILFEMASLLEDRIGDREAAIAAYRDVLSADPSNTEAFGLLSRLLGETGAWPELAALLEQGIARAAGAGDAAEARELRFRLGRVLQQHLGEPARAASLFGEVLADQARHPGALAALEELARSDDAAARARAAEVLAPIFAEERDFQRHVQMLEELAATADEPARRAAIHRDAAAIYERELGAPEMAFLAAGRALEADPDDPDNLALCLRAAEASGDVDEELAALLDAACRAARTEAGRVEILRAAARHAERTDPAAALEAWARVRDAAPDDDEALRALARLHGAAGDVDGQLEALRSLLAREEDAGRRRDLLFEIAVLQEEQKRDLAGAAATLRRLLEIAPLDAEALSRLDVLCVQQERWIDLADVLAREAEAAGARGDGAARVEFLFRLAELREGRLLDREGALALYGEILSIAPDHGPTHAHLQAQLDQEAGGIEVIDLLEGALRTLGDPARLAEVLEARAAATADPEARRAVLVELGELRAAAQGRHDLAFLAYARAFREVPGDRSIWQRLWDEARQGDGAEEWLALQEEALPHLAPADAVALALHVAPICEASGAVEAATRWYERARGEREALVALERIYRTGANWEALAGVLDELAAIEADPRERVNLLFRLGRLCEERLQAPARAVAAYERLLETEPGHLPTLRALEPLHEVSGDRRALYGVLAAQREAAPEGSAWTRLSLRLAEVAEEGLSDEALAATHYREVLARDPRNEAAGRALERLLEGAARWDELAELLRARLQATVDPREIASLHERLGRLQAERLGDGDAAVASFQAVLERDPRNRRALEALRALHAERGEGEALAAVLRRLVPLQDDAAGVKAVRLELAEALAGLGRRDEAIENGKRALDLEPHDLLQLQRIELLFRDLEAWPEVIRTMELQAPFVQQDEELTVELWRGVARVWVDHLQRKEGAAAALERIIERRLDADAFDELRAIYRGVADWRRWAQVTERFAAGCTDEARRVELLRELAEVHEQRLGQRDIAFAKLGAAFERAPADDALRARLAALADQAGMHEELALVYESVIDACEDEGVAARLLLELAALQDDKLDDPEAAEASLRRILAVDPSHAEALEALAALFSRRGADDALVPVLEKQLAAAVDADARRALLRRIAQVDEERLGDAAGAARALERALELDPTHEETREALAALYRRSGRLEDLATLLGRARDLAGDPAARFELQTRLAALLETEIGDDERARAAWALAHELDPERMEPLDALERIHTRHDRWAELVRVYERKLALVRDDEEQARLRLKLASIHEEELGNLHDAIAALEGARHAPRHARVVLRELARLLRAARAWQRLAEVLEQHLDVLSGDPAATAERVELLVALAELRAGELGEPAGAETAWRAALALDPDAPAALAGLGRHLEARGEWDEALEIMGREVARLGAVPQACDLHVRIGRIHTGRGALDRAEAAYRAALSIDPGHIPALRALREVHEARGETDAWLDLLAREAKHTEASEEKARLWNEVGRHRLERGEEELALRAFEEARRHAPGDLEAATALGDLYFAREDWARAEAALEVVCAALPAGGDADAIRHRAVKLYRLGAAAERQEKIPKALQAYARAWESDPGLLPAGEGLARLLVRTGDDAQALRVHQAILIHHRDELSDPEVVELHYASGELRRRLGENEAALKSFRSALELDAWHVDSHRAVIEIAEALGDLALALEHRQRLAEILEGDEKHALLLETARLAADRLGDPWQAIDACVAALRIRPDDVDTAERLVDLYRQTKQDAKAVDLLERLIAEPGVRADPARLARCHLRLGEAWRDAPGGDDAALEKAVEHFNAVLDLDWRQTAAFQAIEALLVGRQAWRLLEANYVRMLKRLPREEASRPARVLLYRTLADLYRNALQDPEAAAEAWKAVTLLAPDDGEAAAQWAELVTGRPGAELEAIDAWRKALPVAPDLVAAARQLERLHARRRNYDAAYTAASVVADLLGKPGADEEGILGRLRPFAKNQPKGALEERHWDAIAHEGVGGPVARIFALVHEHAGALLAADFSAVPIRGRVVRVDRKRDRVDPASMLYLVGAYKRIAATLGVEPPELYRVAGLGGIEVANTWPVSVVAGEEMFSEQGSRRQLSFLLGRCLAFTRHELALAPFHDEANLEVLLQAAVLLGEPRFKRTADAAQVEKVRGKLAKLLPQQAQQRLQKIAYAYARDRNRQSVRAWLEAAELTASRVGALLAGDLGVARHQLAALPPIADLSLERRVRDLAIFALSEAWGDLRKALGMGVEIPG